MAATGDRARGTSAEREEGMSTSHHLLHMAVLLYAIWIRVRLMKSDSEVARLREEAKRAG